MQAYEKVEVMQMLKQQNKPIDLMKRICTEYENEEGEPLENGVLADCGCYFEIKSGMVGNGTPFLRMRPSVFHSVKCLVHEEGEPIEIIGFPTIQLAWFNALMMAEDPDDARAKIAEQKAENEAMREAEEAEQRSQQERMQQWQMEQGVLPQTAEEPAAESPDHDPDPEPEPEPEPSGDNGLSFLESLLGDLDAIDDLGGDEPPTSNDKNDEEDDDRLQPA